MPDARSPVTPRHLAAWAFSAALLASPFGIGRAPSVVRAGFDTIEVTTTEDEFNTDGDCSLREAIVAANTNAQVDACAAGSAGFDLIMLQPLTYTLTLVGRGEDAALTGDLDILESVSIDAVGAAEGAWATIDAGGIDRVFDVMPGIDRWGFRNLEIVAGDPGDEDGGAVRIGDGTCGAGGFPSAAGTIESVTIRESTARRGGGVYLGTCQHPQLRYLSIVRNGALDRGGGFAVEDGSVFVLRVSTVSGNSAGTIGGGIWRDGAEGSFVFLDHVTLAENQAPDGAAIWSSSAPVLEATLIGGNADQACGGTLIYNGGVSDDPSCGIDEIDVGLLPLTRIGKHHVHPLEQASAAIEWAGLPPDSAWCSPTSLSDQVGTIWPQDGDGDGEAWCDAGAIEAPGMEPQPTLPDTAMPAP